MCVHRRLCCTLAILALVVVVPAVFGSSLDQIPQKSHGVVVSTVNSSRFGATLAAGTSGQPDTDQESRPFTSGVVWALPLGTTDVQATIHQTQWRDLLPGELADSTLTAVSSDPQPLVRISPVMTMRGLKFAAIGVNALQPNGDGSGYRVCEHVEFDLSYSGSADGTETRILSSSFYSLARGTAANLDEVVPAPELRPESYLIITRPAFVGATLNTFVNWKRARGHTVRVATTDSTGTTAQAIKNYIQNAYNTWPEPPVFVVLIGDVGSTNPPPMPAWTVAGFYHPWNITDHPYTLLDGTDWLPDVLIGRLSVENTSQFATVIAKSVNYESQPFEPTGAWRSRMLIAGVREYANLAFNSSWQTMQWIRRQMLDHGYTQVDSSVYPGGTTSQISASFNSGVSFAGYRGFGAPNMWDFPSFTTNDVNQLNNGWKLPVVTSIVCGGGAFDDASPCLGEAFIRAGTPANPKGAVGFIGPSELDTKTRWNNTNIAGIYEGILRENVQTLGAAMLRGKLALLQNFPNNIGDYVPNSNTSACFYFYCYNLLGDPGLTFFVGPAQGLSATMPDTIAQGTATLTFSVSDSGSALADVWGTVLRLSDTVVCSRAISDSFGNMSLSLPPDLNGDIVVTLTKPRHMPQIDTLRVVTRAQAISAAAMTLIDNGAHGSIGNSDGFADAGERIALGVVIHNYGTSSFPGGSLSLTSTNSALAIVSGQATIPALASGSQADTLFFSADVADASGDGQLGLITWTVSPSLDSWQNSIEIYAPRLSVATVHTDGANSNPLPNSTAWLAPGLTNTGRAALPASTVTFHSLDSRLALLDSIASYPAIQPGDTVFPSDQGFHATLGALVTGDWVHTSLTASTTDVLSPLNYSLPVGNLLPTDPTHPDGYGYRAYQSTDTGYTEAPIYQWVEIDPTRGGSGTVLAVPDNDHGQDTTRIIALPFDFSFYGTTYDHIGICSNGFISFGQSVESFFRNYSLPALASPDKMICAFWDDLYLPSIARVCTYYDTDNARFIIEWSRLKNQADGASEETFQVMLYDAGCWQTYTGDGNILIQYLTFNNVDNWDNYATIGIQDHAQEAALQLAYANHWSPGVAPVQSGTAILFTTGWPQNDSYLAFAGNAVNDDSTGGSFGNNDGVAQNGETVQLSVRLTNTGLSSTPALTGVLRTADPYLVRLDSSLSFGTVNPGDTVSSSAIRVEIMPTAPHGHVCSMSIRFPNGATPCQVLSTLTISAPVLGAMTPPLIIDDDSVGSSQGNGDHQFNPFEVVELTPGVVNTGGHFAQGVQAILRYTGPIVTIMDSLAYLGNLPQGGEHLATDPFLIEVAPDSRDGDTFVLQIVLRDTFGTEWSFPQTGVVVAPTIGMAMPRIFDPAPGGNGDGLINRGESVSLFPRVANSGAATAPGVTLHFTPLDSLITLADSSLTIGDIAGNTIVESPTPLQMTVSWNGVEPRTVTFSVTIGTTGNVQVASQMVVVIGTAPLFENLESDTNYWTTSGSPNVWHRQEREYHSASHSFYCGDETTRLYPNSASSYLRSPAFNFTGTGTLVFYNRRTMGDASDVLRLHLQLGPSTYYSLGQFSGSTEGWEERRISLTGYPASESTQLRFWFVSNSAGVAEGVYIDDVIILGEELAVGDKTASTLPETFELAQNFPNPFNDQTTIQYAVPKSSPVRIALYDIQGRHVATLVDGVKEPGRYRLSWRPLKLASGIYFIRLDAAGIQLTGKLMYLK